MIRVSNLKSYTGSNEPRPMLYCRQCGAEYSADKGDYWNLLETHVFKCCGRPMQRVYKQTMYVRG